MIESWIDLVKAEVGTGKDKLVLVDLNLAIGTVVKRIFVDLNLVIGTDTIFYGCIVVFLDKHTFKIATFMSLIIIMMYAI